MSCLFSPLQRTLAHHIPGKGDKRAPSCSDRGIQIKYAIGILENWSKHIRQGVLKFCLAGFKNLSCLPFEVHLLLQDSTYPLFVKFKSMC